MVGDAVLRRVRLPEHLAEHVEREGGQLPACVPFTERGLECLPGRRAPREALLVAPFVLHRGAEDAAHGSEQCLHRGAATFANLWVEDVVVLLHPRAQVRTDSVAAPWGGAIGEVGIEQGADLVAHRRRVGEPVPRRPRQRAVDQLDDGDWQLRRDAGDAARSGGCGEDERLITAVGFSNAPTGDHPVEGRADRKQVTSRIDASARVDRLFGGHIRRGSETRSAARGVVLLAHDLRDAKVEQLHRSGRRHEEVGGLDVPMDHACVVVRAQHVEQLLYKQQRLLGREPSAARAEELVQRLAGEPFHDVVGPTVFGLSLFEHLDGAGVRNSLHRRGLGDEGLHAGR